MSEAPTVTGPPLPGLHFDDAGRPATPLVFVDLNAVVNDRAAAELTELARRSPLITVGLATGPTMHPALAEALTLTLTQEPETTRAQVRVTDLQAAQAAIAAAVARCPRAALTIAGLLRLAMAASVDVGLMAESTAYSMLLAGDEFKRWRASRPIGADPGPTRPAVLVDRAGDDLRVTLNRPDRHNAFGRDIRDGLVEALDLVLLDTTITSVEIRGAGDSFCSGGDLDEFGSSKDVPTAHLIRLERSVAARLHRCRERVTVYLHGACIGAGIEIPSFAGRVISAHDSAIRLPELGMGLLPGAGGTVGVTGRIGRWRTAWLALAGVTIGTGDALRWGLVDAVID